MTGDEHWAIARSDQFADYIGVAVGGNWKSRLRGTELSIAVVAALDREFKLPEWAADIYSQPWNELCSAANTKRPERAQKKRDENRKARNNKFRVLGHLTQWFSQYLEEWMQLKYGPDVAPAEYLQIRAVLQDACDNPHGELRANMSLQSEVSHDPVPRWVEEFWEAKTGPGELRQRLEEGETMWIMTLPDFAAVAELIYAELHSRLGEHKFRPSMCFKTINPGKWGQKDAIGRNLLPCTKERNHSPPCAGPLATDAPLRGVLGDTLRSCVDDARSYTDFNHFQTISTHEFHVW